MEEKEATESGVGCRAEGSGNHFGQKNPEIHLFEYRGRRLAFLVERCQLFEVAPRTWAEVTSGCGDLSADVERDLSVLRQLTAPKWSRGGKQGRGVVDGYLRHQPRKISLFVSGKCNFRCRYCYEYGEAGLAPKGEPFMSEEVVRRSVDFFVSRSGRRRNLRITLFGGEPLLNWPGVKFAADYALERARRLGKRMGFSLTTNGSLVTTEMISVFNRHQFALMLSLDGPRECNDACRRLANGEGSFDLVAPRALMLLKGLADPRQVKVRATMTRGNSDVRQLARFFSEFGFRDIGIGSHEGRVCSKDALCIGSEEYGHFADAFDAMLDEYLANVSNGVRGDYDPFSKTICLLHERWNRFDSGTPLVACGICRNDLSVDTEGRLFPCHRFVGLEEFCIGSVHDGVNADRVREIYLDYQGVRLEACQECWARNLCSGPCPWHVANNRGTFDAPEAERCESTRLHLRRALWLYAELRDRHTDFLAKTLGCKEEQLRGPGPATAVPSVAKEAH